jgi:acetyl esterase
LLRENDVPSFETLSPAAARLQVAPVPGPPEPVAEVLDRRMAGPVGELPLRIYRHDRRVVAAAAIVFYHGGGWVVGSLDSHDALCRRLCNACEATVVSVDYRLAPEHRFPAAIDDCESATRWVAATATELKIDHSRITVCGDSAGGNLAAAVTLRLRGLVPLAAQILFYPIVDHSYDRPSYHENAEGYFLSRATMEWFWGHYLAHASDGASVDASPLRARDFRGLPPAYVLTAGYDPLRDEGRAYAQALVAAGVDVTFVEFAGLVHGFLRRPDRFPSMAPAIDDVARFLKGRT